MFRGLRTQYTINPTDVIIDNVAGRDGTDVISGTEFLWFLDEANAGANAQIIRVSTLASVPLIKLTNTAPLLLNNSPVFNHVVNTIVVNDNTPIPVSTGIAVAGIQVADPDGILGGPRTFTLTGPDAAAFQFNAGFTQLQFIGGGAGISRTNYEAKQVYNVTVNVADGTEGGSSINYTLNITDTNDNSPTIASGTYLHVQENTPEDVVVYRVAATDLDFVSAPGGPTPLIFSLQPGVGGEDNALFTMTNNGEIRFNTSPDFELPNDANGDRIYNIMVGASDGVNPITTQNVTIEVTNAADGGNAAPLFISTPPDEVMENTDGLFYAANVFDPDGDALVYALDDVPGGGSDASLFNINQAGEVSYVTPLDFENPADEGGDNVYNFAIVVSDGVNPPETQTVALAVTNDPSDDPNAPPVFNITPPNPVSVNENTNPATTLLYDADATDPNGTLVTLALVAGADNAFFSFDPDNGELRFANSPNFEDPFPLGAGGDNSYSVTVSATSGGQTTTQLVNVVVNDVNEAPVLTITPSSPILRPEGIAAGPTGLVLYDANATDPDGLLGPFGGVPVFSHNGVDAALFIINSNDGELRFLNSPDFEGGGDNNYNVNILATSAGQSASQAVQIQVTDVPGVLITGSAGNDTINATQTVAGQPLPTGEADTINGNAGNDTISALGGNDTINGNDGTDTLNGDAGNDSLSGNGGNDTLNGGDGNDILNGGSNNDTMNGGLGNDIFKFNAGNFGADTITAGFDADGGPGAQDFLDISARGITAGTFAANVAIADLGVNTQVTIAGQTITLLGVDGNPGNNITQADFILAP